MPPSEPDAALGAAIRRLRKREGMTIEELALRSGLDTTAVSRVERGVADPVWSTVRRLGKALGVAPIEVIALAERIGRE